MADEGVTDVTGLNRRSFLKSAGVAVAGGTLSAGLTMTSPAEAVAAAQGSGITNFRCPICGKDFSTYEAL
ncbi:MAG: twin-arginine translocation signal domain-containing protein, partial [Acidobacteriota bacterium]|nr:twin-arginine translocation signal domain-containing protein [Acidobacteriota bacterium]